jgi:hypothetical protein
VYTCSTSCVPSTYIQYIDSGIVIDCGTSSELTFSFLLVPFGDRHFLFDVRVTHSPSRALEEPTLVPFDGRRGDRRTIFRGQESTVAIG